MRIIDPDLTLDQFIHLDVPTAITLVEAVECDLATWSARLSDAIEAGHDAAARRARHALTGLCSTFGAVALQEACITGARRDALAALCHATVAEIRGVAFPVQP